MITEIVNLPAIRNVSCSAGLTIMHTVQGDLYSLGLNRWGQCGVDQATVMIGKQSNKQGMHVFVSEYYM